MVHSAPRTITPEALDDYLARGWFRFGGTMRTTRFTVWEERDLRTTLWTRTRLDDFQWSRSNRRLLSRTRRAFRVVADTVSAKRKAARRVFSEEWQMSPLKPSVKDTEAFPPEVTSYEDATSRAQSILDAMRVHNILAILGGRPEPKGKKS